MGTIGTGSFCSFCNNLSLTSCVSALHSIVVDRFK